MLRTKGRSGLSLKSGGARAGMRSGGSRTGFQGGRVGPFSVMAAVILGLALVMVISVVVWWAFLKSDAGETVEDQPTFVPRTVEESWRQTAIEYESVEVSAEVWDVTTGERASVGALRPWSAASLTKMVTGVFVLHQVESGAWSLDQTLADGASTQWHLEQMVRHSNSYSWGLLRDGLGREAELQFARDRGWDSFTIEENTISVSDTADLLRGLSAGELLNTDHGRILRSYMTDTYEERFIPRSAPSEAIVYHAAGTLQNLMHDAAIIRHGNKEYVLVIMSNSLGSPNYAARMNMFDELLKPIF